MIRPSRIVGTGWRSDPQAVRIADDWEERWVIVEELARLLGRNVPDITNKQQTGVLDRLSDDWDTLAVDDDGWQEGFADPEFLGVWREHRQVYGYSLRSELVYQLLSEMRSAPDFTLSGPIDVFLVDEYQDLNRCDLNCIQLLARRSDAEVFAAGDDDQSIYSFRSAHPAGIRGFTDEYPDALEVELTECLRCGRDVVDLAKWLISQDRDRRPKGLESVSPWDADVHFLRPTDQDEEASGVAQLVDSFIDAGARPEDVLVLLKSDPGGRSSTLLRESFDDLGIDYYLPRAEQDLDETLQLFLEYMTLGETLDATGEIDDLSLRSILQLEDNGIGDTRIAAVIDLSLEEGRRFFDAIEHMREQPGDFGSTRPDMVVSASDEIRARATELRQREGELLRDWIDRVGDALELREGARTVIERAADQVLAEHQDVEGEPDETALAFAQEIKTAITNLGSTLPPQLEGNVTVTTMHGAKGLTADIVFVLQVEDEVLPGDATGGDLAEARRLLYVSLTRARRHLYVTACSQRTGSHRFMGGGEAVDRDLSRFLRDYGLGALTVDEAISTVPDVSSRSSR